MPIPIVHAVTTPDLLLGAGFARRATAVMEALGGRGAVQLRGAGVPARRLLALALELAPVQAETGCWLVVNDRLDVALAAAARGGQLTSRSMTVTDARRVAPGLPLGASVHSVAEARVAANAGADWLVAGHVFQTASHPGREERGIPFLAAVCAASTVPVIAIGGVTPADVPALRAAGSHGVAVIRGIWGAGDPERAATDYLSAYDADAGSGRPDDRPHGERRAACDP
ncbi:MAG: thiamine phosphate synthase [Gemmatimonadaceae bacterium]